MDNKMPKYNNYYNINDEDSFKQYMDEVVSIPLLTKEEEYETALKAQQGDKEARQLLIDSNLRLVVYAAKKIVKTKEIFLDLIQEGNIGLITAVDKFNPNLGYRFSTYAMLWINERMTRYYYKNIRIIKTTKREAQEVTKYKNAKKKFIENNNREPSNKELCEILQISLEKLNEIKLISNYPLSLNAPIFSEVNNDESWTESKDKKLSEFVKEEDIIDQIIDSDIKRIIKEIIEELPERQKIIVKAYYGFNNQDDKSLKNIGKDLGITGTRVKQIKNDALIKIRKKLIAKDINY